MNLSIARPLTLAVAVAGLCPSTPRCPPQPK